MLRGNGPDGFGQGAEELQERVVHIAPRFQGGQGWSAL